MKLRSNTLCWNPMEAYYFTCSNEDYKYVYVYISNSSCVLYTLSNQAPICPSQRYTYARANLLLFDFDIITSPVEWNQGKPLSAEWSGEIRSVRNSTSEKKRCYSLVLPCVIDSLYTYDMRHLDTPVTVHMDHVSAVLDVDYSPTGTEFVSASFDKSIRIFPKDGGHSRYGRRVCGSTCGEQKQIPDVRQMCTQTLFC